MSAEGEYRVYVGAYTSTGSGVSGIRLAIADSAGRLRCTDTVAETLDPSFLALAPGGGVLYAVNELCNGRVVGFTIEEDGSLSEINSQPSLGSAPCFLCVHPGGRFLLTANYGTGSLVVHPIREGGVLSEACHAIQHSGVGPNPARQRGPHAHQVLTDPAGRYVFAVDLGADTVYVYDFDQDTGHMAVREEVVVRAGSGPRHLAFHPSGTRAYLISELVSTVTEFGYDPDAGRVQSGRTLSTLPRDFTGTTFPAEIVVSRDGRFAYASNRGHDSIAIFDVDDDFRLLDVRSAEVAQPRHISFSPDERVLFVAGQHSGTIQAFAVGDDGDLTAIWEPASTPCPVCVLPVPQQ